MIDDTLNIAAICSEGTNVLGPGKRFVIWVQGCPFDCFNCTSPDWIPIEERNRIKISSLVDVIFEDKEIEGLTISGGEPMLQANGLSKLCKMIKERDSSKDFIVFTGFESEKLIRNSNYKPFLKWIDVLISEKYIDKLNNNKGLRGSSNQKIHFLSDKLLSFKNDFYNQPRKLEYFFRKDEILMVGLKNKQ